MERTIPPLSGIRENLLRFCIQSFEKLHQPLLKRIAGTELYSQLKLCIWVPKSVMIPFTNSTGTLTKLNKAAVTTTASEIQ